jgi:hypothetical protein
MADVPDALLDRTMVLVLPYGDGETAADLRARDVPVVGLDAEPANVAAARAAGVPAWVGGWRLLRHHRHELDGAWVDLATVPADEHAEAIVALAAAVVPSGTLVLRGALAAPLPPTLRRVGGDGTHLALRTPGHGEPELPAPGPRVMPVANLFRGARFVVELGCGHGRMLDALHLRGMACAGIEPDAAIAAAARARGHTVFGSTAALAQLPHRPDGCLLGDAALQAPDGDLQRLLAHALALLPARGRLVVVTGRRHDAERAERSLRALGPALVRSSAVPGDPTHTFVVALAADAPPATATVPLPELPHHPHWLDAPPRSLFDLERHERRVLSQGGEDGVLEALFARLGSTNRRYVEFGCGDGVQCNTAALRRQGWQGLLMDGVDAPGAPDVHIVPAWITAETIEALFDAHGVPAEPDLMSIDLDGNDWWVWRAIRRRPRVVVAEYNGNLAADRALVMPYDPGHRWDGTNHYGASLLALQRLGREKGYTLVYASQAGVNAFFVRDDLVAAPAPPFAALWRPANYWYRRGRSVPDLSRAMLDLDAG